MKSGVVLAAMVAVLCCFGVTHQALIPDKYGCGQELVCAPTPDGCVPSPIKDTNGCVIGCQNNCDATDCPPFKSECGPISVGCEIYFIRDENGCIASCDSLCYHPVEPKGEPI